MPVTSMGDAPKARCGVCGLLCLPRNLTAHLKRHGSQEFVCVECGKVFKCQKDLNSHNEIHQSTQVVCPECGIGFRSKAVYRNHRARKHSDEKRTRSLRTCSVCYKQFHPDSLHKHMRRVHSLPKTESHTCTTCKKHFTCAHYLKRHMETHMDVKTFPCNICSKLFKTRRSMEWHRKKEHKEEEEKTTKSPSPLSVAVLPSGYSIQEESITPFSTLPLPSPLLTYSPNYSSTCGES